MWTVLLLACTSAAPPAASSPSTPVPEDALPAVADARIVVDKSDHQLVLYDGDTAVKTYRVGLGDPVGDKGREGDKKTPTGTFTVVTRNERSSYHLFLGLSYPTAEDAERGLREGLIGETEARAIREAEAAGRQPPWNTALGGAIGIHGNGGSSDWTLGCVAVEDEEIEQLWGVVPLGTEVVIRE